MIMAYAIGTALWASSLLVLSFVKDMLKTDWLETGAASSNVALSVVFTAVYLFFLFLVWWFQRKVNS